MVYPHTVPDWSQREDSSWDEKDCKEYERECWRKYRALREGVYKRRKCLRKNKKTHSFQRTKHKKRKQESQMFRRLKKIFKSLGKEVRMIK